MRRDVDRHILMEDDGFYLIAQPGEYWASWIAHTKRDCNSDPTHRMGSFPWRYAHVFEGKCAYCQAPIPDGLLGAWKLHNYEHYTKALRIRRRVQL